LNNVDRGTEKYIMETLEVEDTDLAEEIKKRMFVFEDILTLDNRSIQRFLREVDNNQLAIALKGTNDEVKNKILPICPNVWLKWSKRTWNSWSCKA